MKYKVGDIVKLRDDLQEGKYYGDYYCSYKMAQFRGEKATIAEISEGRTHYTIEEDCRLHCWTDEMIQGLWEECKGITYEPYEPKPTKLKLIDVLNKIANGELKEGTKFVYRGNMYIWEDNMILNTTNSEILDIADRKDLNMELELIEPQEPTECEHEWSKYSIGRLGRTENYRRCKKCGIHEEDIEPTDNTTEKIEELDINEFAQGNAIDYRIVFKLNEVIRKINKEG